MTEHDKNLLHLDVLTDRLVPLSDLIYTQSPQGKVVEYKMDDGTCLGFGLLNQVDVAVQKSFITKGARFPLHIHAEVEFLIVFKGQLHITGPSCDYIIGVGECAKFPPGSEHGCEALSDVWLIGITIPSSEGYPHVPKLV